MHVPIVEFTGPKGCQLQVSEALHAVGVSMLPQLVAPLEHVTIGMGVSRTGMHQPAVAFHTLAHHWQHLHASHSAATGMVQLILVTGPGGAGAASTVTRVPRRFTDAAARDGAEKGATEPESAWNSRASASAACFCGGTRAPSASPSTIASARARARAAAVRPGEPE